MRPITGIALLVLILATLACSITPRISNREAGPVETFAVDEAYPSAGQAELRIEMGAGRLNLSPGADNMVAGTVEYNVDDWTPEITRSGDMVTISQDDQDITIPGRDLRNDWDLQIGSQPLRLQVAAGAYQGDIDLSGLALTDVEISDGASQAEVRFDDPNPEAMERFYYKTGASEVKIFGLGNANAEEIRFESGAGSYTLDFAGDLQRDVQVSVSSGLSSLELIFPDNANVRVEVEGGLNNVDLGGAWDIQNDVYTRSASGSQIDVRVDMGLGNLKLTVD